MKYIMEIPFFIRRCVLTFRCFCLWFIWRKSIVLVFVCLLRRRWVADNDLPRKSLCHATLPGQSDRRPTDANLLIKWAVQRLLLFVLARNASSMIWCLRDKAKQTHATREERSTQHVALFSSLTRNWVVEMARLGSYGSHETCFQSMSAFPRSVVMFLNLNVFRCK